MNNSKEQINNNDKVKVIFIDDHAAITDAFQKSFADNKEIEIVVTASNGDEALRYMRAINFDIAIVDLNLRDKKYEYAPDLSKAIKKEFPEVKIIIYTDYCYDETYKELREVGINAFISKAIEYTDFELTIKSVFKNDSFINVERLKNRNLPVNKDLTITDDFERISKLSPRERQVALLLKEGLTDKEIAAELDISHTTVHTHRVNIFKKLGINCIAELVKLFHQ